MKTIRNNVFETNSSSTHTIIIPKEYNINDSIEPRKLVAHIDEFGWEYKTHRDLLDYIYTGLVYIYGDDYKEYTKKIYEILRPYNIEIEWVEPEKDDWGYSGYIDHGYELEDFYKDLFNDTSLLINAVINGYVNTGNDNEDNGEDYEYDCTRKNESNEYRYFKGN